MTKIAAILITLSLNGLAFAGEPETCPVLYPSGCGSGFSSTNPTTAPFLTSGIGYALIIDHDEYAEATEEATTNASRHCSPKGAKQISEWKYVGPYKRGYSYLIRAEAYFVCE
jgi:hypothetical protein